MQAWVFFYKMKELELKKKTKMLEQLFGKIQKSNYGRYQYQIKGILPKGSYVRPIRSAVIVKKRYVSKVSRFFDSYQVKYKVYEIKIFNEDFEKNNIL